MNPIDNIRGMRTLALSELLDLAQVHVTEGPMASSAALCLADAVALHIKGQYLDSARRAVTSLEYSIGRLGKDFRRARDLEEGVEMAEFLLSLHNPNASKE